MADDRFNWLDDEDNRAENNQHHGRTENVKAPRLKIQAAPQRTTRGVYVDDEIWSAFEEIIFQQKKAKGKTKPELAEEALLYVIEKYK